MSDTTAPPAETTSTVGSGPSGGPPRGGAGGGTPPRRLSSARWRQRLTVVLVLALAGCAGAGGGVWLADHRGAGTPTLSDVMGLSTLPPVAAPGFTLTDQNGQVVSLSALRGRAVVLNFFDDRCIDICPLIAQELVAAAHRLGATADQVAFVAVNVNAAHPSVSAVRQFTNEHGLQALHDWYYLTGPPAALRAVWDAYNVSVQVDPATGSVFHTTPMYFIGRRGRERAIAAPGGQTLPNGRGRLPPGQLQQWATGIAREARLLLAR